jgi:hypothetical protein
VFASSLGKPQKGFAYTIVINSVLSSKLLAVLTASPIGTLAMVGTEYSRSDFWAIAVVADGVGVTGSFVSGVAEEETVRNQFFHRSASGFLVKGKSKLV